MKKRIISAILVIVMSVMALASCAPAFNFAEDDISGYVTFNYEKFKEALLKIEIEDGDFTTDEETRKEKVRENIFSAISTAVISNALDSDKKDIGKISERDVVYYCYYATDDDDNVFFFSNMREASITATSTKADHVVQLGSVDDDDELKSKIAEALLKDGGFDFGTDAAKKAYNMLLSGDFDSDTARRVGLGDKIVISYERSYTYTTYEKTEDGKNYVDKNGNITTDPAEYVVIREDNERKEICKFELVTVSTDSENPIVKYIAEGLKADADNAGTAGYTNKFTVNVGASVTHKDDKNATVTEFKITGKEDIKDGEITRENVPVLYKYSNVKVDFKIDNPGVDLEVKHTLYPKDTTVSDTKEEPDSLHTNNASGKVDLKEKELTYHVFPVYYLSIPEISAESILQYIVAKNITDTYFDAFDGDYMNGDDDVKALVSEVKNLFSETYESGDDASETHKNLAKLKKALTDAEATLKEKGDKALQEHRDAVTDAKKAYVEAQREAIADAIGKLTAAKKGEELLGKAIYDVQDGEYKGEYYKNTYDKLEDAYEKEITNAVEKKVYELIFADDSEICKINDGIVYPEKLLKEFKEHLYESYEYNFYNGKVESSSSSSSSSKESNYKRYEGDLQKYLYVATGAEDLYGKTEPDKKKSIDMAIEKEAKEAINPLFKLYAVAKALDADGVAEKVKAYVDADILAGAYLARYEDNKSYTDKQNEEAREVAEKNAKENEKDAKENAADFLITDAVFKKYKKAIGTAAYRNYEKQYGEINIRASLQFNRLFYYLTCTELEDNKDDNTTDVVYKDGKIDFRTIEYTIVEDDGLEDDDTDHDDHDHDH